jgi:hypothetical protein
MSKSFRLPQDNRLEGFAQATGADDRALKNFRYVVGSVNNDALRAWEELWEQLNQGVTPGGMILPEMQAGFTPAGGWPEFLEKFWLLKHYLDYIHRFCQEQVKDEG